MLPTWIIDTGVSRRRPYEVTDYGRASLRAGCETIYLDFDHQMPADGQFPAHDLYGVAHGSIGFAEAAAAAEIRPGAFLHGTNFQPQSWLGGFGMLALADVWRIVTYSEFKLQRLAFEEEVGREGWLFVKTASGGKALTGLVLEPGRPLDDAHYGRYRKWHPLPDDHVLLVARPHDIVSEWRFIIADGLPIAASSYHINGEPKMAPSAPDGAWEMAQKVGTCSWQPQAIYAADIALRADGEFRLVEINQFGTSCPYAIDADAVVEAANAVTAGMAANSARSSLG